MVQQSLVKHETVYNRNLAEGNLPLFHTMIAHPGNNYQDSAKQHSLSNFKGMSFSHTPVNFCLVFA